MPIKLNRANWNALVRQIIATEGVERMSRVAEACNADAGLGDGGYMVSHEGDDPLQKRDYIVTVITATAETIRDNAENQRLLTNFVYAEGD